MSKGMKLETAIQTSTKLAAKVWFLAIQWMAIVGENQFRNEAILLLVSQQLLHYIGYMKCSSIAKALLDGELRHLLTLIDQQSMFPIRETQR